MPPTTSSCSDSAKVPHRIVFESEDSSSSDGERHKCGGDSLAREMKAAAERERRKNLHAESGRARPPRAHPLAPSGASTVKASSTAVPHTAEKTDLFGSDSSSSDAETEDEAKDAIKPATGESSRQTSTAASLTPAYARGKADGAASKTAHVQGLSFRRVQDGEANGKKHLLTGGTEGGDDEESSSSEDVGLHINKAYAARYEEQKRKQELHTLTEKYKGKLGKAAALGFDCDDDEKGEKDSSDDEEFEEDDDALLLTHENNLSFAKALLAVRKATVPLRVSNSAKKGKTAAVASAAHDEDSPSSPADSEPTAETLLPKEELLKQRFFPPAEEQIRVNTDVFERRMAQKRRKAAGKSKFTLADEYKRALEATAGSEDAVVDDSNEAGERDGLRKLRPQNAEEAKLRAAFLRNVEDSTNTFEVVRGATSAYASAPAASDNGEDSADEDEQQRGASEEEKRLLEEAFALSISAAAAKKSGKKQQGASGDGNETDSEAFLRDFFIQELWRPGATRKKSRAHKASTDSGEEAEGSDGDAEGDDSAGSYYNRLAQLAREEEDEAFFNNAEVWEREYQEKKYRHQEAEEEAANGGASAAHELKRLKHLKRKEIEDQRALIASVAGLKAATTARFGGDEKEEAQLAKLKAVWSDKDLDAPFDPAEFDRKMAQLFDSDYYDERNVDEDEIAYFDEELDKESGEDDDGTAEAILSGEAPALFAANSLEEAQSMMPAVLAAKAKKKGKSTESETDAELMERLQASLKQKEEEYYQLHRDVGATSSGGAGAGVSGGFRYREVPAEDFTLSVEEILALDDRQLNMIAPMNCYAAYLDKDSNERDRRRIERRRQKGFRQVDSDRTSRRYGNVKSTSLLNPEQINDEEGKAIAANLSKRLREEGEDPDAPLEMPNYKRSRGRGRRGAPVDLSPDYSTMPPPPSVNTKRGAVDAKAHHENVVAVSPCETESMALTNATTTTATTGRRSASTGSGKGRGSANTLREASTINSSIGPLSPTPVMTATSPSLASATTSATGARKRARESAERGSTIRHSQGGRSPSAPATTGGLARHLLQRPRRSGSFGSDGRRISGTPQLVRDPNMCAELDEEGVFFETTTTRASPAHLQRTPTSQLLSQQQAPPYSALSESRDAAPQEPAVEQALFTPATVARRPQPQPVFGEALRSSPSSTAPAPSAVSPAASSASRPSSHDEAVQAILRANPPTMTRPVQLKPGYTVPSPQTPLWAALDADEDEDHQTARGSGQGLEEPLLSNTQASLFQFGDEEEAKTSGAVRTTTLVGALPHSGHASNTTIATVSALGVHVPTTTHECRRLGTRAAANGSISLPAPGRSLNLLDEDGLHDDERLPVFVGMDGDSQGGDTDGMAFSLTQEANRQERAQDMQAVLPRSRAYRGAAAAQASATTMLHAGKLGSANMSTPNVKPAGVLSQKELRRRADMLKWAERTRAFFHFIDARPLHVTASPLKPPPPTSSQPRRGYHSQSGVTDYHRGSIGTVQPRKSRTAAASMSLVRRSHSASAAPAVLSPSVAARRSSSAFEAVISRVKRAAAAASKTTRSTSAK
ncbi:KRI1-like C-terminal family protein [Leishmania donovani]|uniref:KRI1-like C-terminal family protein n=1 Tax=Leishmania donovani TaxID=5661 RepID=A0A504XBX7_LEIDO|nr:KRI1-like C-terminal family protein [Leishmania donovani]